MKYNNLTLPLHNHKNRRGLKSKVKEKDIEIIDDANKMFRCSNKEE